MSNINEIIEATIKGDHKRVPELTATALAGGLGPEVIIQEGFIAAMEIVGQRFSAGELYLPEMMLASRAMKAGLEPIKPLLAGKKVASLATVVLGTVAGDMHDIGKNLVAMMLEGAGATIVDLGVDVSADRFVEAVTVHRPHVIGLSALLTTTMPEMLTVIEALAEAGLRDTVQVIVGGAPISQKYADKIGADGYAPEAGSAITCIKTLLGSSA